MLVMKKNLCMMDKSLAVQRSMEDIEEVTSKEEGENSLKGRRQKKMVPVTHTHTHPIGTFRTILVIFCQKKVGFSRPITMTTKISQKVEDSRTPPPLI